MPDIRIFIAEGGGASFLEEDKSWRWPSPKHKQKFVLLTWEAGWVFGQVILRIFEVEAFR